MTAGERLRALRATKELGGFSEAKLHSLLPHLDELCVAPGEQLAHEGRPCHQFLVVAIGLLETRRQGRAGKLAPGDSFGWHAMHDRGVNDSSVSVLSPAHLLVMSHEQFRAVLGLSS